MVLNKKNSPVLIVLLVGGFFAGLLGWELLERLIRLQFSGFSLTTNALVLDLDVLAISLKLNPGTILGMGAGVFLFKTL